MAFWNKKRARAPSEGEAAARRTAPEMALRVVRAYHEQTKHNFQRYATGPLDLDWDTQPDPFRRFAGAPELPLPLPESDAGPDYGEALVEGRVSAAELDAASISRLLFDSLAISAWKESGEMRWALRVNPSSGNLHPTEGYLLLPQLEGLAGEPGVYHYAPREHLLERRAALPAELWQELALAPGDCLVALTSIHWREAWKYGERAFRYCQHDVGHALAALAIGAAGLGWRVRLVDQLATPDVGRLLGLPAPVGPEAEHPDCLLVVGPTAQAPTITPALLAQFEELPWSGVPNDLSSDHVEWDAIELTAEASRKPTTRVPDASDAPHAPDAPDGSGRAEVAATPVEHGANGLREVLRRRRSGLAFDGQTGMPASTFFRIMESCMPRAGRVPFASLPWRPRLHLALFVHRVEGLTSGLYWLQRSDESTETVRAACREEALWTPAEGCPPDLPLSLLLPMDLRSQAAQVSCGQAIARDGAFSLGMLAEFDTSLDEFGAWFYPRMFWEAGAIGQMLYLEAEAVGLRSTGIGCFFDDPMHSILGLKSRALQSLYHFTVGQPVHDARLSDRLAYPPPTQT